MKREEILDAAKACVTGKRAQDYGSAEDNFGLIAQLWTSYTGHLVTAQDVALMMALLKIARIKTGTATDDSFVDLAGYAACGGEIADAKRQTVKEWEEEYLDKQRKVQTKILRDTVPYGCTFDAANSRVVPLGNSAANED